MPKKAVVIVLLLALAGAAVFVYFTFPRTKDEFPRSNNQRPFPSSPGPNGLPVPDTVPHPTVPLTPPGPKLRVMAWATPAEAQALTAETDAFATATGTRSVLTLAGDEATYRRDLRQALSSDAPPDICLIDARDFSGIDPEHELIPVTVPEGTAPRAVMAFTSGREVRAVPDEFSVEMLFYNAQYFDEAGIGFPDRHWTWDIMEAITRGLASLKLKSDAGAQVYPLELPADFDLWNILSAQAGHPALDRATWHLTDAGGRESQMRGLDLIHEFFREFTVTAPLPQPGQPAGSYFARQQASLLIAPSEFGASLPTFRWDMTLLPSDMCRGSLARVDGWGVTARSEAPVQALALARFLAGQPVHAGWSPVQKPADPASHDGLCYEALDQALIPRLEPKTERLAQLLDGEINMFARGSAQTPESLYARIQSEYRNGYAPPLDPALSPGEVIPKADTPQLRGL